MKKTKSEILESVLESVRLRGRSLSDENHPLYIGKNGMRCAVGIFINEDKFKSEFEHVAIDGLVASYNMEVDEILRLECHGHGVDFWTRIQILHDTHSNWSESDETPSGIDLSERGKLKVENIKLSFGLNTAFRQGALI